MKFLFAIFLATIFSFSHAQFTQVTIPGSQVRKITSSIVEGQEYVLHIMLPSGYESSNKQYPVLYLMDSQWDFPLVTALYGQQYYDGFIPDMIIVGVTWGGTNPKPDSLRARDYTPSKEARLPQSGGAASFLSFIKKELIPFLEGNYKVLKNDRTLMGCSLGGLFTLFALFTEPDLFARYVAASPAIGWDREVISQYEKQYAQKAVNSSPKLYMCMGGVERGVPAYEKFAKQLASSNTMLNLKSAVLENTGHSGTKGEGYARGLQFVFQRPSLNIDPALLKPYVGRYKLPNGSVVDVKMENDRLVLYFSSNNRYTLQAASEKDFYSNAEFLNIKFKQGGFEMERYGGTLTASKVE